MKLIKFSIVLATFVSLVISSCSKSSTDDPALSDSQSSISATIAGQAWASIPNGAIASINQSSFIGPQMSFIQIAGFSLDQKNLSIQFPFSTIGVGTYNFTSSSDGALVYSTAPTFAGLYTSNQGTGNLTLTITSFNLSSGIINGTFSGKVFNQSGASLIITNGIIANVKIITSGFYSNGSMSLKLNSGNLFTMDNDNTDGKFLMIGQNSFNNDLILYGYNTNLGNDFGIYVAKIPKNASAGTYNVVTNADYNLGIGKRDGEAAYNVTSGSITITSNMSKNIVGTFNFIANNGVTTKTVTNGSINFTFN